MNEFLEYEAKPAEIRPDDPKAREVFERVKGLLQPHFPGKGIVHFGSTAVEGLRGKGVIDLFILADSAEFHHCIETLESLGFQYPTFRQAPMPEHRPFRVAAIAFGGATYRIHVHLTTPGSRDHRNAVRFVEALRRSPQLRKRYEAIKEEAIGKGITTSPAYANYKTNLIEEFLNREAGASATEPDTAQ